MSLSAGRGNVKCQQEQEEVRVEKGRQFILFFLNWNCTLFLVLFAGRLGNLPHKKHANKWEWRRGRG